jgi:zinc protease
VLKCYEQIFIPDNAEITIVSNLTSDAIVKNFTKLHKNITGKQSESIPSLEPRITLNVTEKREHVELDNPQSTVVFATSGMSKTSPKRFALLAAMDIFGEPGLLSRLAREVRDKHGFVYGIGLSAYFKDLQSAVIGGCAVQPGNVDEVIELIKKEYKKLYEGEITAEELQLFKEKFFAHSVFDSNENILKYVTDIRHLSVKFADINSFQENFYNLTVEEVNDAAKEIANPENLIFVDCGRSVVTIENKEAQ